MDQLLPEGYLDLLGTVCVLLATIFAFISLSSRIRLHTVKLLIIFIIISISLFANHWGCYFAAIFIVATALTELEFLQNLAAIIRGSKEYFDYQKEFMSQKEVEESIEQDTEEIAETENDKEPTEESIQLDLKLDQLGRRQVAMIIEEFTFKYLERKYGCSIQRHIRYRGKGIFTEFDGIMERQGGDIIFEVKTGHPFIRTSLIEGMTLRTIERVKQYQAITHRKAELHMVLVGTLREGRAKRIHEYQKKIREKEKDMTVDFEIFSPTEIGLPQFEPKVNID